MSMSSSSPELRANLTRQHSGRDPFDYYQIEQLLGKGSMGSVAKVCRKIPVIASRSYILKGAEEDDEPEPDDETQGKQSDVCFNLPLVGGLFSFCVKGTSSKHKAAVEEPAADVPDVSADQSTAVESGDSKDSSSDSTTSTSFAMKSIHLQQITNSTLVKELENEVNLLKTLDHPHIVRVLETFKYEKQLWVVMELCSGGDLYTRDPYTEEEAARICSAMCAALTYMHSKGVLHRDLKYENVLFVSDAPQAEVKLIDFGLSKTFEPDKPLTEGAGTIYTIAPEVLKGEYSKQADLWSMGVIAYMLLSSQMPFYGKTRRSVAKRILSGKYDFAGKRWKNVSQQAKAFVEDLLVVDPDDRATADEALSASWLNRRHGASVRNPHVDEINNMASSIKRFVGYSKLRKLALMIVAHKSTSAEIGPSVRKFYQIYDQDGCGQMDYQKFKSALVDAGYVDENYREIFDAINMDGSGLIRYSEFVAATIESTGPISEERLAEAFDRVDHDGKGYISEGNLKYLLGDEFPDEEIHAILSESGSGDRITYSDFLAQFKDDAGQDPVQQDSMIHEVMVLKRSKNDDSTDKISDLTSDVSDSSNDTARFNFVQGKALSERKALESLATYQPKSTQAQEAMKKIMVDDDLGCDPIEEAE